MRKSTKVQLERHPTKKNCCATSLGQVFSSSMGDYKIRKKYLVYLYLPMKLISAYGFLAVSMRIWKKREKCIKKRIMLCILHSF